MASPQPHNINQPGLGWEPSIWGADPVWTIEPSQDIIQKLAVQHLGLTTDEQCVVTFFDEGAFNKLYSIKCHEGDYIFRVALPVAPKIKTLSEIATVSFIQAKTTIPVPKILAYDANLNNELGFEWILMEKVKGRPLHAVWHEISWLKKGLLIQKIADYMAQLSRLTFPTIGSLFSCQLSSHEDSKNGKQAFVIGDTVVLSFIVEDRIFLNAHRGPFHNSFGYLRAHLHHLQQDIIKLEQIQNLGDSEAEYLCQGMREIYSRIDTVLPKLFPPHLTTETTSLRHSDLSFNNILVDSTGDLVAIVDWECVAAVPAWEACDIPRFLNWVHREEPPEPLTREQQEDPGYVEGYEEDLLHYESVQLKAFFLEEMQRIAPEWMETYNRETTRREILLAIDSADNDIRWSWVKAWLDVLIEGKREPKRNLAAMLE